MIKPERRILRLAVCGLCLFATIPCSAKQTPAARTTTAVVPSTVPPDYSKEAFVIQKIDTRYTFHADGTWDETVTAVIHVQSQAGIQAFGNLSMGYAAANQQAKFSYVRVRKPDGSVVPTPASNIQDEPAAITLQAPLYSDLRLKQVPVANLNPGDTLEYQLHLTENHAEIPDQFYGAVNFVTQGIVLEEDVEIRVPSRKYVKVVSATVQPTIRRDGNEKVYEWKTSHLQDAVADQSKTAATPSKPSIQLTTFQSWQQLGEWYRTLLSDRAVVTPAIRKQEQQITAGLTTDDAKQRAIYAYASTQFRYIGLSFGIGRLQPHMADAVLQNKFGDCKDKHTVFAALMQAAGYPVWPALINSATKLDPDLPSPTQFDHMISVLPQGKDLVWLDTTEQVAPFGMLMSPLRDKLALVIPTTGAPALKRTPLEPPFPLSDNFTMKAAMDDKAILTGHADMTARGDMELLLRAIFHATPRGNWNKLGQNVSYLFGFSGTVSNFQADDPDDTAKPFHIDYDYMRTDYGGSDGKQITLPLPPVPFLMGENDKPPEESIPLGATGERDFRATVTLPKGEIATLVTDKDISTDFAEYRETSSVKDGMLTAERFYKVKQSKLPTARWQDYLTFVKAVQARENLMVQLATPAASTAAPTVASNDSQARDLMLQAYHALQAHRFNDAEDALRQVQALNPTQQGLWATYAVLDLMQNKPDEAMAAFHKEFARYPDNPFFYETYAKMLIGMRRTDDAVEVLRTVLNKYPETTPANLLLGELLMRQKRYPEAVTFLKKAANAKDGTAGARIALGQAEIKAGQKDAGIADLETALKTAQEPIFMNDAAYELVNNDADIAEAQQYTQKAVQQMETAAGKTTLATLTNDNLSQVMQLSDTWDTIGWIDFKLGRDAEAERYVHASWILDQHGAVADHLGQIDQKEGRRKQAAQMYRLALAAGGLEDSAETTQRLNTVQEASPGTAIRKSKNVYVVGNVMDREELSKLRTFPIAGLPKKFASAEFFVLIGQNGVDDVQFIQGSESLRAAIASLKKVNYGAVLPDDGPEKIARRGILSCSADTTPCEFVLLLPQTARTK